MEENNSSSPLKHEDPSVTLTIRLIMQGKEVGSIIGKRGEIVNRFREESGAKINISDGSCPERIVTVSGTTTAIFAAFTLITKKFEEWCSQFNDVGKNGKTQIPIRLIVPASQCGSLIGKSGSKIKEIRQATACSIQVASEMLPNSTERAVTLSGTAEQITQCIYQICQVMLESPPRGATIPYRPKPQVPLIVANGQAYTIQGNYAVPAQEVAKNPLASLAALGLAGITPQNSAGLNPTAALAALAGSQLRTANTNRAQQQQHEMTVSNDLIGCIIGKGGTKIAEIRQISGAMIRISNCLEREGSNTDRTITISGNPDAVAVAHYLINMSIELQKANLQDANANSVNNAADANSANGSTVSLATTTLTTATPTTSSTSNQQQQTNSSNNINSNHNLNSNNTQNQSTSNILNSQNNNNSNNPNNSNGNNNNNLHSITSMVTAATNNNNNNNNNGNSLKNNNNNNSTRNISNPLAAGNPASLLASAIPLAQLLAKPGALNALSSLSALGGLSDLLGGLANLSGPPVQTTGVHRTKSFASSRFRNNTNNIDGSADTEKARNKFQPY